jgi:hypothetical protein
VGRRPEVGEEVQAINFVGDALRDALDPRLRTWGGGGRWLFLPVVRLQTQ